MSTGAPPDGKAAPPGAPSLAGLRTERIQALCDGVFAVAMTLLILDVRVPAASLTTAALQHELLDLRPKVVSYVFSFVILGIYWVGHHNQYHYIKRTDRTLLWINILFLVTVAFVPFSAALIAEYPGRQVAVVIYGVNLIATGLALYLHWWYATRKYRLVDPGMEPAVVSMAARRILLAPAAYLLAICLSFFPPVSIAIYILVPVVYILPARFDRYFTGHHPSRAEQAEEAAMQPDGELAASE